jgi:predicted methyltransferase
MGFGWIVAPVPVPGIGRWALVPFCLAFVVPGAAGAQAPAAALHAAIADPARDPAFVARDGARHPAQELAFFDVRPNQSVVEIWPSGGYWTEILAPYLHDHGVYYAALPSAMGQDSSFAHKLAAAPARYGRVRIARADGSSDIAPPGSVDRVLTFRNLHNWMKKGDAAQMLASFYRALKPGGILGFEEHRGNRHVAQDPQAKDGYVNQDTVVALAGQAGFRLVASSEMNANPKDTAQWPAGVWTLPPTFALGAKDHDRYAAIGEGDNMVLKFRKP